MAENKKGGRSTDLLDNKFESFLTALCCHQQMYYFSALISISRGLACSVLGMVMRNTPSLKMA